ncbi:transglutaminase domain-containing protein [Croceimicrobium sp.]|uniref:transglutaminase domain-containing protein n=1 Tax=Croceimicrobium sp. TaxID=2828340 RepID=UPI003BAD8885
MEKNHQPISRLDIALFFIIFCPLLLGGQIDAYRSFNFKQADSIASHYYGVDLSNLHDLSLKLTEPLNTDVERFRAIYLWICQNIKNDYRGTERASHARRKYHSDPSSYQKWSNKFRMESLQALAKERKGNCYGYSFLLSEMSKIAGIECIIIGGYGRLASTNTTSLGLPNHSWNAVLLEGKWYLCDPTWSSGYIIHDGQVGFYEAQFNPGYFLCPPEHFILNHLPLDSNQSFLNESPSKAKFLSRPIFYGAAFEHGLFPNSDIGFENFYYQGDTIEWTLNWTGKESPSNLTLEVESAFHNYQLLLQTEFHPEQKYIRIKYVFERSGSRILHFKWKDEILFSCKAEISKS